MAKSVTFEDSIKKLESIIDKLENDKVSLSDSLKLYNEGIEMVNTCNTLLDKVEKEVKILDKKVEVDE